MNDPIQAPATLKATDEFEPGEDIMEKAQAQPEWQTPQLEDVSEQVMAQPYIRFT